MEQYSFLAGVYDSLNSDFDYEGYADYIDSEIRKYEKIRSSLVLDLACGTGKITFALRDRGYDMTGVDLSEDMLSVARDICYENDITDILWLCQSMQSFELYGTVDACVCCLDSLNYLTSYEDIKKCFSLVHNYLIPDGVFIFDMNTPYKFENTYGNNAYVLEDESSLVAWQNEYNKKTGICKFYLNIFVENQDGTYTRYDEVQREKCYSLQRIKRALSDCGFEIIRICGDTNGKELTDSDERCYFTVRCLK
ncbi:MAG: class I SAM-dependent methyltransferase [Clostridia bacterium]|nr:class I SAM-dependent methyltransferase [Clostridia bacterium]